MKDNFVAKGSDFFRSIFVGLAFTLMCALIQHSSTIFGFLIATDTSFFRSGPGGWESDISRLQPGLYYVSVGRPRGNCDLVKDEITLASNRSATPALRGALMLDASFRVESNEAAKKLSIVCYDKNAVWGVALTHTPIIASYRLGVFLQLWRTATELLLGPIFSLLLIASILFQQRRIRRKLKGEVGVQANFFDQRVNLAALFFSVMSLLYSVSLAHFTRLFIEDHAASLVHIVLRNAFSLSVVILYGFYSRHRISLIIIHAIAVVGAVVAAQFPNDFLVRYYDFQYVLFPIATALMTVELFRVEAKNESIVLLRYIATAWTLVQIIDTTALWIKFGAYTAPAMLAMMASAIAFIKYREKIRSERIEIAAAQILAAIKTNAPVKEVLSHMASIIFGETHFARVSAYIDGFCVGYCDEPKKVFVRVMESGYLGKDTLGDSQIDLPAGRGQYMAEAIRLNKIVVGQGKQDRAWFVIIPLAGHAVLNLSDNTAISGFAIHESCEVLERLFPALQSLNSKLIDHGLRQGFALERLRSIKGDGRFEGKVGSVFADINDYSFFSERFGQSFPDFISAVYFPALIKSLSQWSVPEFIRGDEVYFVNVQELIPDVVSLEEALCETLNGINQFLSNEGARLCSEHGFPVLSMSIGANIAQASIICDPIKVRTAGAGVNEAKRLQEAAGRGEVLIRASVASSLSSDLFIVGEEIPVLIKKNFILARKLIRRKKINAA